MKRVKIATILPFALGVFIGTMITSFLLLTVQSIDEGPPVKNTAPLVDQGTDRTPVPHQEEVEEEPFAAAQLISFNVLTSQASFTALGAAIHRTWGGEQAIQGNIDYYIHPRARKEELDFASSRKMRAISLEATDREFENSRTGHGTFKLWENICVNKQQQYLWFVKARDDVYLRRKLLESLLSSLNSSEAIFLGSTIHPTGKERENLGLREGEGYCHEGCYVLSQKALRLLCPKLEMCRDNARSTNEDVEVARCLREQYGLNCTIASEMKELIYNAESSMEQADLQTGDYQFNYIMKKAITLTPLVKPEHLYNVHRYYASLMLDSVNTNNTRLRAHMIETAERGAQSDSLLRSSEHQSPPWTKLGVNLPYKPSDIAEEDVIHFRPLDGEYVYSESKHYPKDLISRAERDGVNKVFDAAVKSQVSRGYISNTSTVLLESTLQRTDPQRGSDYFFEVVVKNAKGTESTKLLHGLQELFPVQVADLTSADYKTVKVNFIVATPPVSRGFQRFMMSFENSLLARNPVEPVGMLVIIYSAKEYRVTEKDTFAVSTLISLYRSKYPKADLRLITIRDKYSRKSLLKTASEQYSGYELLFLADIHIDFTTQFLERCRMNAREDKQVYFPVVFNPYKPLEFHKERILYPHATKFQISSDRGSWMQNSYHLACIYNYDLMKILLTEDGRAGEEDWSLVDSVIEQKQLRLFRAVEPSLVHMWQDGCKEVKEGNIEEKLCHKLAF